MFGQIENTNSQSIKEYFSAQRRKSILKTYDPQFKDGVVHLNQVNKVIPSRSKSLDRRGNTYASYIPFQETDVSKFVCTTPFPIGHRPHKEQWQSKHFSQFVTENNREDLILQEDYSKVMIHASWPTQVHEVKAMMAPSEAKGRHQVRAG